MARMRSSPRIAGSSIALEPRTFLLLEGLLDEIGRFELRHGHQAPSVPRSMPAAGGLARDARLRLLDKDDRVLTESGSDVRYPQGCGTLSFAKIASGGHLECAAVVNRCGTPRRAQSNRDEHDWRKSIDAARAAADPGTSTCQRRPADRLRTSGCASFVAMVKSTHFRECHYATFGRLPCLPGPASTMMSCSTHSSATSMRCWGIPYQNAT